MPQTQQPVYQDSDPAVAEANSADDVVGNGIFSAPGAPSTTHAGTGIFAGNFAVPGYLYREQPTQPSEIVDTTTGAPLVYQPDAGGSWYDDTVDAYRSFDLETPRPYLQHWKANQYLRPVRASQFGGFGDDDTMSTVTSYATQYGPYVAAGLMIGAAAALVWHLSKR